MKKLSLLFLSLLCVIILAMSISAEQITVADDGTPSIVAGASVIDKGNLFYLNNGETTSDPQLISYEQLATAN